MVSERCERGGEGEALFRRLAGLPRCSELRGLLGTVGEPSAERVVAMFLYLRVVEGVGGRPRLGRGRWQVGPDAGGGGARQSPRPWMGKKA